MVKPVANTNQRNPGRAVYNAFPKVVVHLEEQVLANGFPAPVVLLLAAR
jgi:hypothetical protein